MKDAENDVRYFGERLAQVERPQSMVSVVLSLCNTNNISIDQISALENRRVKAFLGLLYLKQKQLV